MIEAKEEVMTWASVNHDPRSNIRAQLTTRLTLGACCLTDFSIPVVPIIAGSSKSVFVSVTLKWKGLAVWITTSNGGSDCTALSKAPGWAMSSTIT